MGGHCAQYTPFVRARLLEVYNVKSAFNGKERGDCPMPESGFPGLLRTTALIALLAGAVGSVGLMLHAGRHNHSQLLLALFTFWVLSPFVALALAEVVSKRWSGQSRVALYSLMLILTLGTLGVYAVVTLGPPRAKPAAVFLVVPSASWLLIAAVAALTAARRSRLGRSKDI
jgi:peptidoglycan/LPS O-acetylase OafA/YrhL